jgi:hypothetical protein
MYEKLNHPLIQKVVVTLNQPITITSGKRVILVWLPNHTGLAGSVSVDAAAQAALNLAESQTPVPFSDFYPLINTHVASHLQRLCNAETNNMLHNFEPKVILPVTSQRRFDQSQTLHQTYAPYSCFFAEEERLTAVHWLSDPSDCRAPPPNLHKIPADMSQ